MIRSLAVARVAARLGKRGTGLNTDIVSEMQAAQLDLEAMPSLPWFLGAVATETISAAATTLAVPTGYIMDDEYAGGLRIDDADGYSKPIGKQPYDFLKSREEEYFSETGDPEAYALQGSTAYIFPAPSTARSYEWWYYKAGDTLDEDSDENVWLLNASGVLIALTGVRVAQIIGDDGAEKKFEATYNRLYQQMIYQSEARKQANLQNFMGG